MVVCITFFGQAVRIAEGPLARITPDQDFSNYINSMWCVIVTMTTVGFGDIYPKTLPGRIVIFLVSLVGVVVVSVVVVTIQNIFMMSPLESKACTIIKKIQIKTGMTDKAAKIVGKLTKLQIAMKRRQELKIAKIYDLTNLMDAFGNDKRKYKNLKDLNDTEEIFREFDRQRTVANEMMVFMSVLGRSIRARTQPVVGTENLNEDGADLSEDARRRSDDEALLDILCRV